MKRKGFITFFVLIISAICLPIVLFAGETLFVQSKLNSNRVNMVQGEFNIETEINSFIYDESGLSDSIINIIRRFPNDFLKKESVYNIPISSESDLFENISGELSFENKRDDRPKFNMKILGDYKDIQINKNIVGGICNSEVDDCDDGLVYLQNRSEDYIKSIEELLSLIPDSIDTDFLPSDHSLIRTSTYNNIRINAKPFGPSKLYFDNKDYNYINIVNNKMILLVKTDGFNKNNILIDCSDQGSVVLNGIIYIENGDLTFKGKCNFQGLVLIKDGEIKREGEELSSILGKVVLNSFKDPRESVQINYDSTMYLKYAKYLPPLMEPEIIKIGIN